MFFLLTAVYTQMFWRKKTQRKGTQTVTIHCLFGYKNQVAADENSRLKIAGPERIEALFKFG